MTLLLQGAGKSGKAVGGGGGGGAESAAFLARTSGLDSTHSNAYIALIDGLVADGIWSKFDALYIFATQDSTTALLNLVSATYNATSNNSPTFNADRGFTGVSGGNPYIDTGFNPASASSPKYVQDSAHLSMWNLTNTSFGNAACGIDDAAAHFLMIYPKYDGTSGFMPVNQTALGANFSVGDPRGHNLANRSSSTARQGYRNASSIFSESIASATVPNGNIWCLFFHNLSGGGGGNGHQHAMLSFGSSLSSTDVTNFYNRLRTFMTVVGVP